VQRIGEVQIERDEGTIFLDAHGEHAFVRCAGDVVEVGEADSSEASAVRDAGPDVVGQETGELRDDVIDRPSLGEMTEDQRNPNAMTAHRRPAEADGRVDDDSVQEFVGHPISVPDVSPPVDGRDGVRATVCNHRMERNGYEPDSAPVEVATVSEA